MILFLKMRIILTIQNMPSRKILERLNKIKASVPRDQGSRKFLQLLTELQKILKSQPEIFFSQKEKILAALIYFEKKLNIQ